MSREAAQHVEMNNPDQNVHQEDEQKQEICLFSIWQDSPATAEAGGRHLIVDDGLRPLLNSDCVHPLGPTEHEESCLTVVPPGQQRPHHGPKAEQVSPGAVNLRTFGWVSPNMDFSFRGHSRTKLPNPVLQQKGSWSNWPVRGTLASFTATLQQLAKASSHDWGFPRASHPLKILKI